LDNNDEEAVIVSFSLKYILFTSLLILVLGVLTIVFGYSLVHGRFEFSRDWPDFEKFANFDASTFDRAVFADLILLCGTFAILTAFMGCASYIWKKSYFLCPFAALACIIGFVFIIAGVSSMNFNMIVEESYN
jgi:uncharacterized membrane protein